MRCSSSLRGCLLSITLFIFAAEWMFSYFLCEVWHWRRNINMGIYWKKQKYIFCDSTNIEENLLRQAVPYDIRQLMYTCNTWKDALIPASMMWLIRVMDLPAIKMSYLHVIHHKRSPFFQICYFPWGGREGGGKGLLAWFEALFFPCLPRGVRACQDGLGHFFPRLPVWHREVVSKAIWAMPIKNQHI